MVAPGVRLWIGRLGSVLLPNVPVGSGSRARPQRRSPRRSIEAVKAGPHDGMTGVLAAGADVNARDNRGRTALMAGPRWTRATCCWWNRCCQAQAEPNVRAPDGATALFIASRGSYARPFGDHPAAVLMKAGADPTDQQLRETPLHVAVFRVSAATSDVKPRCDTGIRPSAVEKGDGLAAVISRLAGKTMARR